jgi:hypothetical protein
MWIDQYMRPKQRTINMLNQYSKDMTKCPNKRVRALLLANLLLFSSYTNSYRYE